MTQNDDPGISSDLSVLVVSCDQYSDIWSVFFTLFWKHWPDCPYPVYLGVNHRSFLDHDVKLIYTGDDKNWSFNTRLMLEQIPTNYVLLFLEDFLIYKPVNTKLIQDYFNYFCQVNGGYLRLKSFPKPDKVVGDFPQIGLIEIGAPYRTSLQAAIWNKTFLLSLLKDGETAWDFEIIGSHRSNAYENMCYSTWKPAIRYEAAVTQGKWLPHAWKIFQKSGIVIDEKNRPILTNKEYLYWYFRGLRMKLFNLLSWKQRRVMSIWLKNIGLFPTSRD